MDLNTPRVSRSRPRLDYAWIFDLARRRRIAAHKVAIHEDGVTYVRCGGGYRVVRRLHLPGEER